MGLPDWEQRPARQKKYVRSCSATARLARLAELGLTDRLIVAVLEKKEDGADQVNLEQPRSN
jgi:hypothetical protein